VITPVEGRDEYDNPTHPPATTPRPPRAARSTGSCAPRVSTSKADSGRRTVTDHWWAFTYNPIRVRERVEHDGRTYTVDGEPER
jgi:hypothetical protein